MPFATAVSGMVFTTTSYAASRACASVSPTAAVCGAEYVTRGTAA